MGACFFVIRFLLWCAPLFCNGAFFFFFVMVGVFDFRTGVSRITTVRLNLETQFLSTPRFEKERKESKHFSKLL